MNTLAIESPTATTHEQRRPTLRIDAERVADGGWAALWRDRELLLTLARKDIAVRYKQTALGVGWTVLQPLATAAAFALVFGRWAGLESDGVPYGLFALVGVLGWTLFSGALAQIAASLVHNANLLTKVYFPRLLLPASKLAAALFDFLVATPIVAAALVWHGFAPAKTVALAPLAVALIAATALGAGLWLAALNVRYRDVRHALPFATQFWMYLTPVAYAGSLVPDEWRVAYAVNPLVSAIEGLRAATLGTPAPSLEMIACSTATAALLLFSGWRYFRHTERTLADVV